MNVKNCPRCDRIFVHHPGTRNLCPHCIREEEEHYEAVRTYLRKNPGANVIDVANETGVDEDTIVRYIKEGRLEATSTLKATWPCDHCKEPIDKGNICLRCQDELASDLRKAAGTLKATEQEEYNKMRRERVFAVEKEKGKKW
ncbi:hypothetical protein F9B85_03195 [Heliorestis acidaminivorans]|uniref:MerR family transcriptional regulator n=1 Tax=Heliorestis acidaminivorans TaxID=553427 RepID=A0A6I0F147_9FIRM|nr:hypothetical protein [Heliorestis acidaminivorans]KAB2953641.1 hypothetical protein F9B85_03195 [Heliorestis acidaminivorans]